MTIPGSGFLMEDEGSCLPYTPEEEKQIIKDLTKIAESNLKEGNIYYILCNKWFLEWKKYIGEGIGNVPIDDDSTDFQHSDKVKLMKAPRPGLIDNSHLIVNGSEGEGHDLELIPTLMEEYDYVLAPQEVWKKLHYWYKGGPALPRRMIQQSSQIRSFSVEVYPLRLQLTDARDNKQFVIHISKKASVSELYHKICEMLQLEEEKVQIWDYFNKIKGAMLTVSSQSLVEVNLSTDQDILLELQVDDGYWSRLDSTGNELALVPIEPSRSSLTIAGGPTLSNSDTTGYVYNFYDGNNSGSPVKTAEHGFDYLSTKAKDDVGGLAGLQNLGNTCFMNSAIQCLVHTPPLVEYFLQDYSDEINKQNPLGMHGELAIAFGDLLRKLWSSGRVSIAPRVFKGKLARFAPQFSGYNQHDSQELLAFLLDGLHEDLNRVKLKPYIELKDANGRSGEEFANECWENHKARNDSVIVDVCQGQYKSTLICPDCSKVSVTFDPFMYLSLPLPSTVTREITVTVFYGDGTALPMPFTVTVLKDGSCKDLLEVLSAECCLRSDETLLLAEVHAHSIYRYLENPSEELFKIKNADYLVAYRLSKNHEVSTKLEIVHHSKDKFASEIFGSYSKENAGTPLVTYLKDGPLTRADVQNAVQMMLTPLLKLKPDHPLKQVLSSKDNGPASRVNIDPLIGDCDTQSVDEMELDEMSNEDMSFQLFFTDGRGLVFNSIENDTIIRPGKSLKVLLDWSDREHDLYDLIYLKDLPVVHKSGFPIKKIRQEAISLFSCLEAFLKEEPLGPDDMWYCPNCKEHRQAMKKLDLWRLPEILVVHLKRFSYSRYMKNKLDTFVNFPISNLDLSKYVTSNAGAAESHVYKLYAISNHYGGLGGGHYSAYAKLLEGNRWYDFDDSFVTPVSEDDIQTSQAYVLFYRRSQIEQDEAVDEPSQIPSASTSW
ncbi:hypothetical protein GIB67_001642 [Kingdonia uniflora]|uniref:Ubiquitin carboxyl-terminal hydrolase n=1 Tax=Kingdonia uniflora TaxID=39325 RepID=A0A7J7L0V5_9MAGN|nr:hypothetical protein GIB67_001642 [Kingdonia uniflora]